MTTVVFGNDMMPELTRDHIEGYLAHLHDYVNPRSGKPLAARSRHIYVSPLLQFSRETSQWGWDDVPSRPLLSRSDLPKVPSRLPRFIPRQELDRLMAAVEELEDPYQRAALLLVRWSGARRGEISRLDLDCLDAYPDGYPRLRIPVGKTYTERMIPLHPQAADALRDLIDHARTVGAAARYGNWAHKSVRWVFNLADRGHTAPGQRADLILVSGDPLADITATRAIERIWRAGVLCDRRAFVASAAEAEELDAFDARVAKVVTAVRERRYGIDPAKAS
ncbi:MAG: tyrosine-type recombinase/integrase [Trebonia sp.]